MIVGFDNDGPDIFQRQYDFAMGSPVPIWSLGALEAPAQTPLHARLEKAGRLMDASGSADTPWHSNIIPTQMTRDQLVDGLQWLCNGLYAPDKFGQRMLQMINGMGPQQGPFASKERQLAQSSRVLDSESLNLLRRFIRQGPAERKMYLQVAEAMADKPGTGPAAALMLFRYSQVRCLYEQGSFWEPHLADVAAQPEFALEAATSAGLVSIGSLESATKLGRPPGSTSGLVGSVNPCARISRSSTRR